jgi:hypothetical protein
MNFFSRLIHQLRKTGGPYKLPFHLFDQKIRQSRTKRTLVKINVTGTPSSTLKTANSAGWSLTNGRKA